ncbi:hypothetical protein DPMN_147672 [Dreissena polymorpha]|uniref:Uncharacterized protein n=1 Tax=Dreissena polymorpha TaxID=45954 RepID=A0A9D4FCM1_DREPO|nr:hypothetical protein DPMN_147672 [Dreissena polymorpha]
MCFACSDESICKYCMCCERVADGIKFLRQRGYVHQLKTKLDTLREKCIQKKEDLEESIQSLEKTYNTILEEIHNLREEINEYLDTVEMNTVSLLDTLLLAVKTSVQEDILVCKQVIEDMNHSDNNMQIMENNSDTLQCIMYSNCRDESFKAESMLHGLTAKRRLQ